MDAKAIVTRLASEVETLPDVCGVLFFGSAQRGEATTHSDIDLYVLTTGDQAWHEGRVVAGAPVELSFSPLRCMRDRVRQRNPVVTHAFAFGTILLDRGGEVAALSTEARSVWSEGPTALSEAECLSWRFQLTDLLHDVLDLCHDTLAERHAAARLVQMAIDASTAVHRCWPIPRKGLTRGIRDELPTLAPLVESYYASSRVQDAVAVGRHALTELGGCAFEYRTDPRTC